MDYNAEPQAISGLLFDSNNDIEATAPAQQDEVHGTIEPIHPFVMRTLLWSGTGYGLDFFGKGSMRFWLGWSAALAIKIWPNF